ncbi:MAG: energy transducer TonB [Bacteroidota bacterium]
MTDAVKLPEFPGGKAEMFKYLMTSIKYPKSAKLDDAQGIVLVGFIVDRDGSIQDIEIVESVRQDLDTEAIRVIKAMPNWIPGEQNGEPIPVSYKLPVRFSL